MMNGDLKSELRPYKKKFGLSYKDLEDLFFEFIERFGWRWASRGVLLSDVLFTSRAEHGLIANYFRYHDFNPAFGKFVSHKVHEWRANAAWELMADRTSKV